MSIHTDGTDSLSNFKGVRSGRCLVLLQVKLCKRKYHQVKFVEIINHKETPHHVDTYKQKPR